MASDNAFLCRLSPALFERLNPHLRTRDFASGDILFRAGDKVSNVYFWHAGAVSLVLELSGGEMIESAMIGRDSLVGGGAALDGRDAMYKAIVQVAGSGSMIEVGVLRQVADESEELRAAIIRHEQLILAQAQQSAACNAVHNLHERLARWLLRVRDVTGGDAFVLTQEFIAEMLGVRRTSVSIVAHQLQQAGLISYRRGHISIDNLTGLQDAACECYATVKGLYDKLAQSRQN
jgi:CRP-like cAMP-binding protein